jgi:hypothetical protein
MRWRSVVVEDRRPSGCRWRKADNCLPQAMRSLEMKQGLVNGDGVQPHDVAVIIGQLGVVVILASRMVGLEMTMNC